MNITEVSALKSDVIVDSLTAKIDKVWESKVNTYQGKAFYSQNVVLSDETGKITAQVSFDGPGREKFKPEDEGSMVTISSYHNEQYKKWVGVKTGAYQNKNGITIQVLKVSNTANISGLRGEDKPTPQVMGRRETPQETDATDNEIAKMSDDEFKEWARRETQKRLDEVARDESTPPKVIGALTRGTGALTNQEAIQQAIVRQTCLKCAVEVVKCPTFNDKSQEDLVFAIKEMARELEQWVLGNDSGDKKSENNDIGEAISSEYIPF